MSTFKAIHFVMTCTIFVVFFHLIIIPPRRQLDLPHHRPKPLYVPVTRNNESTFCTRDQYLAPRVAFISWLVTFFLEKKYVNSAAAAQSTKNGTEVIPKLIQVRQAANKLPKGFPKTLVALDVYDLLKFVFFA